VTRIHRAQHQQHTLQPTAAEFVPQAKWAQAEEHGEAQDVNSRMRGAAVESPVENESVVLPQQACSESALAAAGESADENAAAAEMFTCNNSDLDMQPVNTPILRSQFQMEPTGNEPLELNNQLESDSTKGSSGKTTVVALPGSSSEFTDKNVIEGLQFAARREPDGSPTPDLFTFERKAAGLQPQPTAEIECIWLQEATETRLRPVDYCNDSEFCPMYQYLLEGKLTGSNDVDKKTLLLADQHVIIETVYCIECHCLKVNVIVLMLQLFRGYACLEYTACIFCILCNIQWAISLKKSFAAMYTRFYWQRMHSDLEQYIQTCDLCLKAKSYRPFRRVPLNP